MLVLDCTATPDAISARTGSTTAAQENDETLLEQSQDEAEGGSLPRPREREGSKCIRLFHL